MAIQNFSNLIKNHVYKKLVTSLDKNIVNSTVDALRTKQQVSSKTSFYLTEDNLKQVYKTIAGFEPDSHDIQVVMEEIRSSFADGIAGDKNQTVQGKSITVNGQKGIFFESIGFDTITERITKVLEHDNDIQEGYAAAEEKFYNEQVKVLQSSPEYKKLSASDKQKALNKLQKEAKRRGTFGFYFNKGHVISVAANLAKQFKEDIEKIDGLAEKERKALIDVLDLYIDKLVKDDLATANLPNAVSQELYARYIKSSDKYLVELQIAAGNMQSGRASIPIVEELRKVFSGNALESELNSILSNSPALGISLIKDKGSPSMLDLISEDIKETLQYGKPLGKMYRSPKVLIGKNTTKIVKPKKKTAAITAAKNLRNKLKAVTKKTNIKNTPVQDLEKYVDLLTLQNILNATIQQQVRQNMGDGTRRDVLNYRTGRFAESVKVNRLTQGREGTITAYYDYMRYPYATFSEGGDQEFPRSRDPKALISKSIREIMQAQMVTKMRAVLQ